MDQQAFQAGKAAYQKGDYATAQALLAAAVSPDEVCGACDHMRGNALMQMGMFAEAADAYGKALEDTSYGRVGALSANRGRALMAAGQDAMAEVALEQALADPAYENKYKANTALGSLRRKQGNPRGAGAAYRAAAIDEHNPDPAPALVALGQCLLELGRPVDAVEALRTALDFSGTPGSQAAIYAQLGEAFVAGSRMQEALDAFNHATADGSYQLTAQQQAAYTAARNAAAALGRSQGGTDAFLAEAGYGPADAVDPLDPLGKSGEFIPSPEDTGFFSISEQDIVAADKKQSKKKKKGGGAKVLVIILILLILIAAGAGFAYYKGFGWPTQEDVVSDLFYAKSDGTDMGAYIAGSVSSDERTAIETILPAGAQIQITGVDRSMTESTVSLTATLSQGGTQDYLVSLVRDGLGWKVSNVQLSFQSLTSGDSTSTSDTSSDSTDASSDTTSDGSSDSSTDTSSDAGASGTTTESGTAETQS